MCPIMTAITENCLVIIMDIKSADCAWELTFIVFIIISQGSLLGLFPVELICMQRWACELE